MVLVAGLMMGCQGADPSGMVGTVIPAATSGAPCTGSTLPAGTALTMDATACTNSIFPATGGCGFFPTDMQALALQLMNPIAPSNVSNVNCTVVTATPQSGFTGNTGVEIDCTYVQNNQEFCQATAACPLVMADHVPAALACPPVSMCDMNFPTPQTCDTTFPMGTIPYNSQGCFDNNDGTYSCGYFVAVGTDRPPAGWTNNCTVPPNYPFPHAFETNPNLACCTGTITPGVLVVTSHDPAPWWPPQHQYRSFDLINDCQLTATECGLPVTLSGDNATITRIEDNESENTDGVGDGNTCNDIRLITGTNSTGQPFSLGAELRVERDGTKKGAKGRLYVVHYTVTALSGSQDGTCTVFVPHDLLQINPPNFDGCQYCQAVNPSDCGTCTARGFGCF
jgi:hypothetical protein